MLPDSSPPWWRGISSPPPAAWAYTFEEFTGDDTAEDWALAAAIFVAQTRRRTTHGPTFSELFAYLLPESGGLPGAFPQDLDYFARCRAIHSFRGTAAIDWRRRRMIDWDRNVLRSLRVGRGFREQSRTRQLEQPFRASPLDAERRAMTTLHPLSERNSSQGDNEDR